MFQFPVTGNNPYDPAPDTRTLSLCSGRERKVIGEGRTKKIEPRTKHSVMGIKKGQLDCVAIMDTKLIRSYDPQSRGMNPIDLLKTLGTRLKGKT